MTTPDARILELLRLAEEEPDLSDLAGYLTDPAPQVRKAAVDLLTETVPVGAGAALARAMGDESAEVRRAAAAGLRELREVLEPDADLGELLMDASYSPDPVVRVAALDLLRALRLGDRNVFARALADPDVAVRVEAVRGLIALDAPDALEWAATDESREVRITVAKGLAAIGAASAADTLADLALDADPLVRAAALESAAPLGTPTPLDRLAVDALSDPNWEVRKGAATALGAAAPRLAITPLLAALADFHIDVRKAAVRSLARWVDDHPEVRYGLTHALNDSDADVRAYARLAISRGIR